MILLGLILTALMDIGGYCKELIELKNMELDRIAWLATDEADEVRNTAFKQVVRKTLGYTE